MGATKDREFQTERGVRRRAGGAECRNRKEGRGVTAEGEAAPRAKLGVSVSRGTGV